MNAFFDAFIEEAKEKKGVDEGENFFFSNLNVLFRSSSLHLRLLLSAGIWRDWMVSVICFVIYRLNSSDVNFFLPILIFRFQQVDTRFRGLDCEGICEENEI